MTDWIKEKLTAGDGSIRKLWGHRLMELGMIIVLVDILDSITIWGHKVIELGSNGVSLEVYSFVFGTALTLLGVGNITDIWKIKYNGKTVDSSKQ